ncbi:MAG: ABC transporter ATP-binding protein [Chloroflexi bacterium]|nr:ABC transporter ATP-binding protein [Chloroflexota bacterium]
MSDNQVVLKVEDLTTHFFTREGVVKAVNGVNLTLKRGRVVGMVGESGSGKSITALSILRLVPYPGRIVRGSISLNGRDVMALEGEDLRRMRGREVSIIFQDPTSGLNPVIPIGAQVAELLTAHLPLSRREAARQATAILAQVGLPDPDRVASQYPFQLSGGMCQRVMIGIATALNPSVLIADEPTSALDVTVQAQILQQLRNMKRDYQTAILLITHDMGVIAQMADEVAVMYAGSVVEYGDVREVFRSPTHPYTWALLNALPRLDAYDQELRTIPGAPPNPINLPDECPFIPRCNKARTVCRTSPRPLLAECGPNHWVACYNPVIHEW